MNNVYKFELKSNIKSIIGWTIAACLFSTMYLTMYPVFKDGADSFMNIVDSFPKEFLTAFGMGSELNLLTSYEGFYIFVLTYIAILSFAFASILTLSTFIKEYKNKSIEFIFAKPCKRSSIYTQKILAVLTLITIYFIAVCLCNILFTIYYSTVDITMFFKINLTLYLLMIIAMMISVVFSVVFNKIRSVSGVGFIIAIAFYFINVMAQILEIKSLEYVSIYGLFNPNTVYDTGYNLTMIIGGLTIFIVLYTVGLVMYERKDVL